MVHWQAPCLSLFQRVGYRGLTPRLSVCCSFEDFDCPFLSVRSCRCVRPFDAVGHHRAACATAGVLGRRGWVLESAAARVCGEGGSRVRFNVFVRDMDLTEPNRLDRRRLEVVADGLPLHGGAQLALDTTMVSLLHRDGTARRGTGNTNGKALEMARRRKERTYPELASEGGRARLVVLGAEVGGRWSTETAQFLSALAWAKVRELPEELEEHGLVGGTWCSDAQPRGQLRCLSSTLFLEGLTGLLHRSTTLFGTSVMLERDCWCLCQFCESHFMSAFQKKKKRKLSQPSPEIVARWIHCDRRLVCTTLSLHAFPHTVLQPAL